MKLAVKGDYASRAMEWLAMKYSSGQPASIEEMARHQRIPANYLVQILRDLKAGGLIKSLRGKAGGYVLARPPEQISFADLLRALHGDVLDITATHARACPEELRQVWKRLKTALEREAESVTFAEIVTAASGRAQMFEI